MSGTYKSQKNTYYTEKTNELLDVLPESVRLFNIAFERTSSPQTMWIYTQRISYFFRYLVNHHEAFKGKSMHQITYSDLDSLTADDVDVFIHSIYVKNVTDANHEKVGNTINNYLSALNQYFNFLFQREKISKNIIPLVQRSKRPVRKNPLQLDRSQQQSLLNATATGDGLTERQRKARTKNNLMVLRDEAIIMLLLRTGIRVSELVGLNIDDINFDVHAFSVLRKRNKPDTVYFDDETEVVLLRYLDALRERFPNMLLEPVFIVTTGKYLGDRISVRSVERIVKKYAKVATPGLGNQVHVHTLRATYARSMLDATNDVKLVQELLAHDSVETTMIYLGDDTKNKKAVRNILAKN